MTPKESTVEHWFMALCVLREAATESRKGKLAVACCIMNRVRHPKWWGNDIYSVVTARWQFSSITDPNDKQLTKFPRWDDPSFQECLHIADEVIHDLVEHPFPGADSYFADYIPTPNWATPDKFLGKEGHHLFYNIDEDHE